MTRPESSFLSAIGKPMPRGAALPLAILVSAMLVACPKPKSSSQPAVTSLNQGKIGALNVIGVKLVPGPNVTPQTTAEKLDPALRPLDPAATRIVVLEVTIGSDVYSAEGSWQPFPCAPFVLTYDGGSAPCVGLSFGDQWILATSSPPEIKLIYYKTDDIQAHQLLFLVPKVVEDATLEVKNASAPATQVARIRLPSS